MTPVIPEAAGRIAAQLQVDAALTAYDTLDFGAAESYTVGAAVPLFARIDTTAKLAEIEAAIAAKAAPAAEETPGITFLDEICIDDFAKVDLRVAAVTACEPIKKAKKLLKLTLDDGSGTPRTVASGIAKYYTPEQLVGRSIVLVANLKPAVLCGVESCGMILAADSQAEDGSETVQVLFVDGLRPGSKIH